MIHVISLGAGVQSSTMALMAAHGEIEPMPELAIFADTGWEPKAVYEWLDWLEAQLPFPVARVSAGNLRSDFIERFVDGTKKRAASIPYFVRGKSGQQGLVRRQCTRDYKINPINQFMRREVLGLAPRQRAPKTPTVCSWRGISADEAQRMKPSDTPWQVVRYPLAMEKGMTRNDCMKWMQDKGYPEPPRSACIGCPYHSNYEWRRLRDGSPDEWADAVDFDKTIRNLYGLDGEAYLHRGMVPLDEAPIDGDPDQGMLSFGEECAGMCGV